jgi:hypothetical protein
MTAPAEHTQLVPPIILVDGHDLMMFGSVVEAERFLEPWAVEDGTARGYDAEGRKLAFRVERPSQRGLVPRLLGRPEGMVRITAADSVPQEQQVLRDILARFLTRRHSELVPALPDQSLPALVADAYRLARTR